MKEKQERIMGNQQHIAILKQGTQAWNIWRQQNPTVTPDLSKGNLSETDLSEANLSEADLSGADLSGADLSGVVLPYFKVHDAPPPPELVFDWEYLAADLRNANLSNTNLSNSNLNNSNFSKANLTGVNFTRTTGIEWEWGDDTDDKP